MDGLAQLAGRARAGAGPDRGPGALRLAGTLARGAAARRAPGVRGRVRAAARDRLAPARRTGDVRRPRAGLPRRRRRRGAVGPPRAGRHPHGRAASRRSPSRRRRRRRSSSSARRPPTPAAGSSATATTRPRGTFSSPHSNGHELTLVEAEVLEALGFGPEAARRNVVTRGIDLNALVGRRFRVGDVECVGRRLCEPCAHLQRLSPGTLRAARAPRRPAGRPARRRHDPRRRRGQPGARRRRTPDPYDRPMPTPDGPDRRSADALRTPPVHERVGAGGPVRGGLVPPASGPPRGNHLVTSRARRAG